MKNLPDLELEIFPLLDLVLTNDPDIVTVPVNLPPIGKSDHTALESKLQVLPTHCPAKSSIRRQIINCLVIGKELNCTDWKLVFSDNVVTGC